MFIAGAGAVGRVGRPGLSGNGARRPSFDVDFVGSGSIGAGGVFIRASTGMYYNSVGTLVGAAINTPRFDYDPVTLQLKGLLLEDASTNLTQNSGNLAASTWGPTGITVTAPVITGNFVASPDGTTTAARIVYPAVPAAGNASYVLMNSPGGLSCSAVPHSFSVWLRGNTGGEQLYLGTTPDGAAYFRQSVTLTTSWQRFVCTTGNLSTAGWFFLIGTDRRDGGQTGTPAQTIYAWGAQVEALPYMSSHIPTTSVSVTRAQDVLLYPAAALTGFKTTGGSWFAEFDYIKNPLTNSRVIGYGGGGVTPLFMRDTNAGSQFDGGLLDTATTTTTNVINKIASTWTAGQAKTVLNAGPVASSAALTVGYGSFATTGINVFTPQTPGGFDNLAGHIRRISYWPRVLSDSEMQAVTTLAGPTLSLDFMTPGTLDPRITFARASSAATYTDANGVIQMAATNLWLYSGDASNATGWVLASASSGNPVVTGNQTTAPDGTVSAARVAYPVVSGAGAYSQLSKGGSFTGTVNPYTMSVYLKGTVGGERVYLAATPDGVLYYRTQAILTTAWQRFTLTTPNLTAVTWFFQIGTDLRDAGETATPAQTVFMWGAQLEQGNAATFYIPTTTAPNSAPRWDYDPVTHALRGLLIEEQRTNIALQSSMGVAPWDTYSLGVGATVGTPNNATAPDGTLTATRLVFPAVSGAGAAAPRYQSPTLTATQYTFSVYLRGSAGGEQLYVGVNNGQAPFISAPRITLTTAWQRYSFTWTATASAWAMQIGTDLRDAGQAATPAQTIYAWGAQVEQGAFPTSYIPTTSAAVTRAADVAVMPTNVSWFSPGFGSFVSEFSTANLPSPGTHSGILRIDDGTNNNLLNVYVELNSGSQSIDANIATVAQLGVRGTNGTDGNPRKIAVAYGGGLWRGAYGGTVVNGTGSATPFPATTLYFGTLAPPTSWKLNGYLRRVTYWNRALSDTEMQQVTT